MVTFIFSFKTTLALSTCKLSSFDVHARIRIFVCVASVHVNETAAPVVALAVHATFPPPDTLLDMAVAVPGAAHAGELCAEVPDV